MNGKLPFGLRENKVLHISGIKGDESGIYYEFIHNRKNKCIKVGGYYEKKGADT